ncbi:hypothetical protein Droror1_Dr00003629 [Drosera rotundifolia]
MFYSHTFLAKKGPLGAVWIASHLEKKLSKRRCENTDIPSTVGMDAVLLGSSFEKGDVTKQLRSTVIVADIDLPENAAHARFEAVTLPETYELDAWDLNDYALDWNDGEHQRNLEEITLVADLVFMKDTMPDVIQPEIEPDVQARDDPMEVENAADKDNEPDSSLRLRDADPIHPLIELPSILNQAKTPADPRPSSDHMIDDMEARMPATLDSEPSLRPHSVL